VVRLLPVAAIVVLVAGVLTAVTVGAPGWRLGAVVAHPGRVHPAAPSGVEPARARKRRDSAASAAG